MTLTFPDVLQFSGLSRNITALRTESESLRTELVTGRLADANGELGALAGSTHLVRKAILDNNAAVENAQRVLGRAANVQLVLGRIGDDASGIGADLSGAIGLSDEAGIGIAGERSRAALNEAFVLLNQRYEGRSLFAGDRTDARALSDADRLFNEVASIIAAAPDAASAQAALDNYFEDPSGGFLTDIYIGGSSDGPRAAIGGPNDSQALVTYTVRADEPNIRLLLRSYAEAAALSSEPPSGKRDILLATTATRLNEASNGVVGVAARVGIAEERLATQIESLEGEAAVLQESFNAQTARDPFEVASALQQIEAQLLASFELTSRIQRLSLVNFLG